MTQGDDVPARLGVQPFTIMERNALPVWGGAIGARAEQLGLLARLFLNLPRAR